MPFIPYSGGYLLNQVKGAVAAYSLRKLRAGVTNAIRVRRTYDSLEKDIGFSGMDLDTAQLLEFAQPNLLDASDSSSAYPNLVLNPSMNVDSNADGVADSWGYTSDAFATAQTFVTNSGQEIRVTASTGVAQPRVTQDISASAGDIISFSMDYITSNAVNTFGARIQVQAFDSGNTLLSTLYNQQGLVSSVGATAKSENLVCPANTAKVRLFGIARASASGDTGSAIFRNCKLKKCAYLTNIGKMDTDSNADGVCDGWTLISTVGAYEKSVSNVNGQYLKFTTTTAAGQKLGVYTTVNCVANDVLVFNREILLNLISGDSGVYTDIAIYYRNSSGVQVGSSVFLNSVTSTGGAFNKYQTTTTVPNDATIVKAEIQYCLRETKVGGGSVAEMNIRNMSIQKVGSAYITKWYDLSGNGNDAVQTTATAQPRIVNNGVLEVDSNGKPIVVFNGTTNTLSISNVIGNTAISVLQKNSNQSGSRVVFADNNMQILLKNVSNSKWATWNGSAEVLANTALNIAQSYILTMNNGTFFVNGANDGTYGVTTGQTPQSIGGNTSAQYSDMKLQELIIFNTAILDAQRQKVEKDIGKKYNISVS